VNLPVVPVFVLKDQTENQNNVNRASQYTIEFEIPGNDTSANSRMRRPVTEVKREEARIRAIKRMQEQIKDIKQTENAIDDIEELENVPAFKRKQRQIDQFKYSDETKVSKYSLFDDEESSIRLSKENPYLHGAVD